MPGPSDLHARLELLAREVEALKYDLHFIASRVEQDDVHVQRLTERVVALETPPRSRLRAAWAALTRRRASGRR